MLAAHMRKIVAESSESEKKKKERKKRKKERKKERERERQREREEAWLLFSISLFFFLFLLLVVATLHAVFGCDVRTFLQLSDGQLASKPRTKDRLSLSLFLSSFFLSFFSLSFFLLSFFPLSFFHRKEEDFLLQQLSSSSSSLFHSRSLARSLASLSCKNNFVVKTFERRREKNREGGEKNSN